MAETFGSQLVAQKAQQEQTRKSRTQRLIEQENQRKTLYYNQRAGLIQSNRQAVNDQLQRWRNEIARLKDEMKRHTAWYNRLEGQARRRKHQEYREGLQGLRDDITVYEQRIKALQNRSGYVESGYKASELIQSAQNEATQKEQKREGISQTKQSFYQKIKTGAFDATLRKLGLLRDTTFERFQERVTVYNQEAQAIEGIKKRMETVGYEGLTNDEKIKVNESAYQWQRQNPNEKLLFDKSGNVTAVYSEFFGKTLPVSTYQRKVEQMSKVDTSLKLGEKEETPKPASTISTQNTPINYNLSTAWIDTLQSKFWKGVKNTFSSNEEPRPPQVKFEEKVEESKSGAGSTASISQVPTPESLAQMEKVASDWGDTGMIAEDISDTYISKVKDLPDINQSAVNALKKEAQTEYNTKSKEALAENQSVYEKKIESIENTEAIKKWSVVGMGVPASWYYGTLVPKDKKLKDTVKTPTTAQQEEQYLKDYEALRTKHNYVPPENQVVFGFNYTDAIARELAGGKQLVSGVYYGGIKGIRENPRTIGFKTAAWATAIAGTQVALTYSGGTVTALAGSNAVKYIGYGLTGLWGASVVARASAGSTPYEKGLIFGDISAKEVVPIFAGGYIGTKIGSGISRAIWRHRTLKQNPRFVAEEKRARFELFTGKEKYPTASPSQHPKKFREAEFSLLPDEKGAKLRVQRRFSIKENDFIGNGRYYGEMPYSDVDPTIIQANPKDAAILKRQNISPPYIVNANRGTITFNKAMHFTNVEKIEMLKGFFGKGYSFSINGNEFILTKYVRNVPLNKFGIKPASHATTYGEFAKVNEQFKNTAGSSEVFGQYFSSEDSLYFALGKGQSSSLYGGSIFGSPYAKPYIERLNTKGYVTIPKGYKPTLTKMEVITYLKKNYPTYPLGTVTRTANNYWKETAYMIEKGRTGKLVILMRKSEIEGVLHAGTIAERTAQKPFYTTVKRPAFYKSLEKINRIGNTEYISRVQKFKAKDLLSPSTLKYKIYQRIAPAKDQSLLGLRWRKVGGFAPMRRLGRVVPIERYTAIPQTELELAQHLQKINEIKSTLRGSPAFKQATAKAIEEQMLTQHIKEIRELSPFASSGGLKSQPISYGEEYGSFISFPKRKYISSSPSYSKSYSSLSSFNSSDFSPTPSSPPPYSPSSKGSSFGSSFKYSPPSIDYYSPSYSPPKKQTYYYPKTKIEMSRIVKEKIKGNRKQMPEIKALFPDFTSRAIGLKEKQVKGVKEALREINRIQTGFEVRRGLKIKGSNIEKLNKYGVIQW